MTAETPDASIINKAQSREVTDVLEGRPVAVDLNIPLVDAAAASEQGFTGPIVCEVVLAAADLVDEEEARKFSLVDLRNAPQRDGKKPFISLPPKEPGGEIRYMWGMATEADFVLLSDKTRNGQLMSMLEVEPEKPIELFRPNDSAASEQNNTLFRLNLDVDDMLVSRNQHARITLTDGHLVVEDFGSTNGTSVVNQPGAISRQN